MRIEYKVIVWNRQACSWDYVGNELPLVDGETFEDKDEAIKFARECVEKYNQDEYPVNISEYHFPDSGGDGTYEGDIEFQ